VGGGSFPRRSEREASKGLGPTWGKGKKICSCALREVRHDLTSAGPIIFKRKTSGGGEDQHYASIIGKKKELMQGKA